MSHASFVIRLALVAVFFELWRRIFMVDQFSGINNQILKLVYQYAKMMIHDNRYTQFKTAQKILDKEMISKEAQLSSSKAKQSVLDFTSRKRNCDCR